MSQALRHNIRRLETTTKFTLAILSLASGVFTYLGVRSLLDGTATVTFLGAVIYSSAVSVAIYAFWTYLMYLLPHVRTAAGRMMLYLAMVLGCAMIMAMSSWLNAAALAGSAAVEQHLAVAAEDYQRKLDEAHSNALAAQSLLPDIEIAKQKFTRLADEERGSGSLTGTSGSGTVVALLTQMAAQLEALSAEMNTSREDVKALFERGGKHLSRMRELYTAQGPVNERSNAFAEEVVALTGVIASLQQTSIAPAVRRTAEDLGKSFIAPAADGATAELARAQTDVVDKVERSVKEYSKALAAAADEILSRPQVAITRFKPLSTAEAVLTYASDFLPSWAGAISIDLLPAVLVFMMAIVHGAIRREEGVELDEDTMTAGQMMRALKIYQSLGNQGDSTMRAGPRLVEVASGDDDDKRASG